MNRGHGLASSEWLKLRDTEIVWDDLFRQHRETYRHPTLVLFTDSVDSACGFASAAVGPFYCPGDEKLYLDLGFYREMKERFELDGLDAPEVGSAYLSQVLQRDLAKWARVVKAKNLKF